MGTPLPPNDHKISLDDAVRLTRRFRAEAVAGAPPIIAFAREGYERILRQDGCAGIRSYPAINDAGAMTYVLVGVDAKGNDMIDGELTEDGSVCPPICPDENVLSAR